MLRVDLSTERERSDRFQVTLRALLVEIGRFAPVLYLGFNERRQPLTTNN